MLTLSQLKFSPANYKTKASAAKALGAALKKWASERGYYDEIEVWSPERTERYSGYRQWSVVWESGPYEWAVPLSMELRGPWGFCEPYYSFDLHFTD